MITAAQLGRWLAYAIRALGVVLMVVFGVRWWADAVGWTLVATLAASGGIAACVGLVAVAVMSRRETETLAAFKTERELNTLRQRVAEQLAAEARAAGRMNVFGEPRLRLSPGEHVIVRCPSEPPASVAGFKFTRVQG